MFKTKEFDILKLEDVKDVFYGIDSFIVGDCNIKLQRTFADKETECFDYSELKPAIRQFFADNLLMINKTVTVSDTGSVLKKITVICTVVQIGEACQIQIELEERDLGANGEAPWSQDKLVLSILSTRYK